MQAPELGRPLTAGERAALSDGLDDALVCAGVEPRIVAAPSGLASVVALWRGQAPVMALHGRIYWPSAPDDCAAPGREPHMAILQHELQHVLEFATGELSIWRYVRAPLNWTYRYSLKAARPWRRYGAEQRASIVEDYWRLQRGLKRGAPGELERYRSLIPWAR
jgi:hypothetical protein